MTATISSNKKADDDDDMLDALLDAHLNDSSDEENTATSAITATANKSIDLDDMLNDMLDSSDDDEEDINAGISSKITDHKERTALRLLETSKDRARWCAILQKDQIRQSAMPPSKPPSRALLSLMPSKSRARQTSENRQKQFNNTNDIFGMLLGRAMVHSGVANNGGQVQLNMSTHELEEIKSNFKSIFRDALRKRLIRDTDFDKKRFWNAEQQFMNE